VLLLKMDNECWREWTDGNEDRAERLRSGVLLRLANSGWDYTRCYEQTRGALVVVQSGKPAEVAAFYAAVDAERAAMEQETSHENTAHTPT
jgi:hypothetical protein